MSTYIPGKIFMLGIGGMGMAPLAIFLAEAGCAVFGQDDNLQPNVRALLEQQNVVITDEQELPADVEIVAYSSAIAPSHPLYQQAEARALPLLRRGELLAQSVSDKKLVAVVGSHGKTTTTAFLAQMMQASSVDCGYVVGGLFRNNALLPAKYSAKSDWVIAEVDESDGTIEHFNPTVTVSLNEDWDHADRYPEKADLQAAMERLYARTQEKVFLPSGHRIDDTSKEHIAYFDNVDDDFNQHNWNAAEKAFAHMAGKTVSITLEETEGIARRQDILWQTDSKTIVADYAHHPTEITALIRWAKSRFEGELIVVFQPHRYTRTQQFQKEFAQALQAADHVFLLPVYAASEPPLAAGISDVILEHGSDDWKLLEMDQLNSALWQALQGLEQAACLFLGAGDIDKAADRFVQTLEVAYTFCSVMDAASKVRLDEPLAQKTTLRVGGVARYYAEPSSLVYLSNLLKSARSLRVPVFILGRGSNLIVAQTGFDGLVIRLNQTAWRAVEALEDGRLQAGAGVRLKELCGQAAKLGLAGFEFLEGIPGSLGGALRMNAGAMGGWMFDVVESVEYVTLDGEVHSLKAEDFHVGYRQCVELKTAVATSAILKSPSTEAANEIRLKMETYASSRKESQPKEPSAGCIFKNPEGDYAGKLVDELGLKGTRIGNAEVSNIHGNFIINRGGATSDDVIAVIKAVRAEIKAQRGIELEPEVLLVGKVWGDVL